MKATMQSSPLQLLAVSAVAGASLLYFVLRRSRSSSEEEKERAPMASGGLFQTLDRLGGLQAPFELLDMAKECKSTIFQLNLPGSVYVVGHYRAMKEILAEADKAVDQYKAFHEVGGAKPNIFTRSTHDAEWKLARKGAAPAFSAREVNRMKEICHSQLDDWIKNTLEPCIEKGEPFDPSEEMIRITFRVIMESAFEYIPTDEEIEAYSHNAELFLKEANVQSGNPFRPYFAFLIPEARRADKAAKANKAFLYKVLKAYRRNPNKSPANTVIKLIDQIESFDDEQKLADMTALVIGGHDTTGFTLSTTLMLLAAHPRVADKLHKSLVSTPSSMHDKSEYMQHVISESNRLLPVTPMGSLRELGRDMTFKESSSHKTINLKKNDAVILSQIVPNRDDTIFDDPSSFVPERWENATDEMKQTLMTFAAGKRNCIGQALAKAELSSVLPVLLSKYKFEIVEEGNLEFFLTLKYVGARLKATRL